MPPDLADQTAPTGSRRWPPSLREHVTQTDVITFLASLGSLVLTFLAGAEIDPVSLRGHWKASLSIGVYQ